MKIYFLILLMGLSAPVYGQQNKELSEGGCGTITSPQQLQEVYDFVQHNNAAYAKGTAGGDLIPVTVHIAGNDNGGGYYPLLNLFQVMCQLNERFAPVNFSFYIKWPINYFNNTSYYSHDFFNGGQMMNRYNVPGTVNIYFVQDPAGNCGYYTYGPDAVAISKSCAGNNSTTVTHELGHFFSLPHTFSGWENNTTPAFPETIRRTGANANCNSSGDGFCDTDADYLSVRWNCPFTSTKTDINGDVYHPDSSMYMSYSSDNCQSRFSAQQIAKMQNNLHTAANRIAIYNAVPPVRKAIDTSAVIYPADTMYNNLKKIVWNRMPGADYYYITVAPANSPVLIKQTAFTADTVLDLSFAPLAQTQYVVNISPVNAFDVCQSKIQKHSYTYTERPGQVGIPTLNTNNSLLVYPNPLKEGQSFMLQVGNNIPAADYQLNLFNGAGQLVYATALTATGISLNKSIELPALPGGLYFIRMSSGNMQISQKLLIGQ